MNNKTLFVASIFFVSTVLGMDNQNSNELQSSQNPEPTKSYVQFLTALHEGNQYIAGSLTTTLPTDQQQAACEYFTNKFNSTPRAPSVYFFASLHRKDKNIAQALINILPADQQTGAITRYEKHFGPYESLISKKTCPSFRKNNMGENEETPSDSELMSSRMMRELEELCGSFADIKN